MNGPRPSSAGGATLQHAGILLAWVVAIGNAAVLFVAGAPRSPIDARYDLAARRYADPLLAQNWRFFAPRPPSSNVTILARARGHDGVTSWTDVTATFAQRVRSNPFSPLEPVYEALFHASGVVAARLFSDRTTPGGRELDSDDEVVACTAAALLSHAHPGAQLDALQLVVRRYGTTPFARRGEALPPPIEERRLPWRAFPAVGPMPDL